MALSSATVALTFLALAGGLDIVGVSLLAGTGALAQVIARVPLGWVLTRVADRTILAAAVLALVASMIVAVTALDVIALGAAQLLLGISRAGFWIACQTQVIRLSPTPARGLSHNMFITGMGNIVGPVLAGAASANSAPAGAGASLVVGVIALAVIPLIARLPLFTPSRSPQRGRISFRFDVLVASGASFATGTWHVAMTAIAPVVLTAVGWSEAAIGIVLGAANAGYLVGVLLGGRVRAARYVSTIVAAGIGVGIGTAGIGLAAVAPAIPVAAVLTAGTGAGVLMTLGPALATAAVEDQERGSAIVVTGMYRAFALLGAPLIVAGVGVAIPSLVVLIMLGIMTGLPVTLLWALRRRF